MNPIFIVLPILLLLMFGLGLSFKPADFAVLVRQPQAVLVGTAAQVVLLPILAAGLAALFRPEPYLLVGLMLIACSPGGTSSNIFTAVAKGDVPLSVTLTVLSSIITVFTIPPVLLYALEAAGLGGTGAVSLPVGRLLAQNVVLMLLPVLLGMAVRRVWPDWAQKVKKRLDKAAFPALLVLVAVFFAANRQIIVQHFASLAWMVSALILAAMALGALLAVVFGLPGRQRRTIVIEVGMQNSAQAIAVAGSPFVLNNETFALPAVIYALMMNVFHGYPGTAFFGTFSRNTQCPCRGRREVREEVGAVSKPKGRHAKVRKGKVTARQASDIITAIAHLVRAVGVLVDALSRWFN